MTYVPKYMTALAAGLDLPAAEFGVLPVGGSVVVDTGIKLQELLDEAVMWLPDNYTLEAQVRPRSGLAAKHGVVAMFGTIDLDYKDTIKVILFNFGKEKCDIHPGDRVAQLVFGIVYRPAHLLTDTERTGGFASTGIASEEGKNAPSVEG
jgi:dUTP pyrophosphatase